MMRRGSVMLAAGLAVLSVKVPATHAALRATRAQCVAACGDAIATDCGGITRRARFARCRRRLLHRGRHLSTATVCPATPIPTTPPARGDSPTATTPPARGDSPTTTTPPAGRGEPPVNWGNDPSTVALWTFEG